MALKISRILHAGYVFECGDTQIAFDPIFENPFSRNCYAFPDVEFDYNQVRHLKFAAIFISHHHDDHWSLESLNLLDRKTPIYFYCIHDELISLIRELGFTQVHRVEIDLPVTIETFEVIARKALDPDVDSLFQIKAAGLNVLNVVDSWIDPSALDKLAREASWDIVLWPFQTMREIQVLAPSRAEKNPRELPREWIEQLKLLSPRYIVPSSCQFVQEDWSWYNHALFPVSYRQFQDEIGPALPASKIVRMNPGISFVLDKRSIKATEPLAWVKPQGDQNVDYEYAQDLKPPTTAEISRHFTALTDEQAQSVRDYCSAGLLEKYRSMEESNETYFDKQRLWRLSLYDHRGEATHLYYKIKGQDIVPSSANDGVLSWTTEVSISKIYAALNEGESLSSMYVRINDVAFAPDIEAEIQSVDILEDPLIRSLFTGRLAAYQAAQLVRIKNAEDIL